MEVFNKVQALLKHIGRSGGVEGRNKFALAYVSVLRFSAIVGSACLMILLPPCLAIVYAFSASMWHAIAWLVIWPFVAALGVTILRPPRQPTSNPPRS